MRIVTMVTSIVLGLAACGGDGADSNGPPPAAARLAFQVQPTLSTANRPIAPAVQVVVHDSSGNPVGSANDHVTLAIATNPSGAVLGGTLTVNAAGGVATFSDLEISRPGTGFTIKATATGLATATSTAFDVTPTPGVAAAMARFAGDSQSAAVGEPVAISPAVKVTDGLGDPVAGVAVTFSFVSPDTTGSGEDRTTDANGVATFGEWRLGTIAGEQRLYATSPSLRGNLVIFTATATRGPAVAIAQNGGDDQVASLGVPVAQPPSVLVTDTYGNPVAGVPVTFALGSGGGSVTGASQVTDTSGVATVGGWSVGNTPGPNTLKAASAGLTGSPVTFHATAMTFPSSATVEVHSNFFESVRNGSGRSPGFSGSFAVDTIAVGGTVTWKWVDSGHNVTPYGNTAFVASATEQVPFTFGPITFSSPGTYLYHCSIHGHFVGFFGFVGMWGRIVVR